ncbi:MAG: hypothetical protein ACREAU_04490 [Nitrosopumilaceae archaeon]
MITFKKYLKEASWNPLKKDNTEQDEKKKRIALKVAQFKNRDAPKHISVDELDHKQKNIESIANLYFYHNMQLAPTPAGVAHMDLPTNEVAQYAKYERGPGKRDNMGFSREVWDQLKHSIEKDGLKVPIDIQISPGAYIDYLRTGHTPHHNSDDVPPVGLLTGNNRIVIAKKIGLETVPVKFHYGNTVSQKDLKTVNF